VKYASPQLNMPGIQRGELRRGKIVIADAGQPYHILNLLWQMTVGTYLAGTQKEHGHSLREVWLFDYGFDFRWYFFVISFGLP